MNKLYYILFSFSFLFIACEEAINSPNNNPNSIIGSWRVDSLDLVAWGEIYLGVLPEDAEWYTDIEFVHGGVLYEHWGFPPQWQFSDPGVWQIIGDTLYIGDDPIGEEFIGTYSVGPSIDMTLPGISVNTNDTNLILRGFGWDFDYLVLYATKN